MLWTFNIPYSMLCTFNIPYCLLESRNWDLWVVTKKETLFKTSKMFFWNIPYFLIPPWAAQWIDGILLFDESSMRSAPLFQPIQSPMLVGFSLGRYLLEWKGLWKLWRTVGFEYWVSGSWVASFLSRVFVVFPGHIMLFNDPNICVQFSAASECSKLNLGIPWYFSHWT